MTTSTPIIESLLRDLAAAMVSKPDRVRVERRDPIEGETLWWLSCAPEDLGKIIGRSRSHARAFEILLEAMGSAIGEAWLFKVERVEGPIRQEPPVRRPRSHDPSEAHELLARILAQLPLGSPIIECDADSADDLFFHFDVRVGRMGETRLKTLRDPQDSDTSLEAALGTLFRAIARKNGVRYQLNVLAQ